MMDKQVLMFNVSTCTSHWHGCCREGVIDVKKEAGVPGEILQVQTGDIPFFTNNYDIL